ncbi:serine protease [Candidatus Pacearchaeota archaeon]|nr:serine protease [Candidatus Pacearchaeota archaeon]
MKKWILRIGLALWLMCSAVALLHIHYEPDLPRLYKQTSPAVVKIRVDSNYSGWEGTGIFVEDDLILTAGHIVNNANEIWIIWSNGKKHKAVDWYKETEADLGIIYIRTLEKEKRLRFNKAVIGEEVYALGNPFAVFPVLTKGIISAIDMPDNFMFTKNMIITDAAINGGNSGCPLFNKNGDILGICSWGYRYSQGMSYFVRAEICELALDRYFAIVAMEKAE